MSLGLTCSLHSVSEVTLPVLSLMVFQSPVPAQRMVGLSKHLGNGQCILKRIREPLNLGFFYKFGIKILYHSGLM